MSELKIIKTDATESELDTILFQFDECLCELEDDEGVEELCEKMEGYLSSEFCIYVFHKGFELNDDNFVQEKQKWLCTADKNSCFCYNHEPRFTLAQFENHPILFIFHM